MQTTSWRRPAVLALLLATAGLAATGCDRRAGDTPLPSTTSPSTTSPSSSLGTLPDSSASAASR